MSLKSAVRKISRTSRGGRTTRTGRGGSQASTSIEDLIAQAPPKKEKVGTMTRLGNVLSAFEPGG